MTDDAFWARVDKSGANGCWLWQGYRQKFGHGALTRNRDGKCKTLLAHRYAWELLKGPIPAGACLLHRCDNPPCCNPDHLFIGDRATNMHDKKAKGRFRHKYLPVNQLLHPHLSRRK